MSGPNDPGNRGAFPWHQPETWVVTSLDEVRALTALRRAHPALRYGEWRLLWTGEEGLAYERVYEGDSVVIVIARADHLSRIDLPVASAAPRLLWGHGRVNASPEGLEVEDVPAWSGAVILSAR
jgi:hypothetical protein